MVFKAGEYRRVEDFLPFRLETGMLLGGSKIGI